MSTTLTLEAAIQQGVAHHQAGRLAEAEVFYLAILKAVPAHPDVNHNLGVIRFQEGDATASLPFFKAAVDAAPAEPHYRLNYLEALLEAGEIERAKSVLQEGKRLGLQGPAADALAARLERPQPNRGDTDLLISLFNQGRYAEAEMSARALTEKFPADFLGWKVLGIVLVQTGRGAEAIEPLQRAVELVPEDAEICVNLGNALRALGRGSEAQIYYRRAIGINPDFAGAHCNLAVILTEMGRLDEAEASCRRALAIAPDLAEAYNNLGNILKGRNKHHEAETAFLRAISLRPNFAEAHCNLGNILKGTGRLVDAETSFRRAIEISPDFADAHLNLGAVLKERFLFEEAESCFQNAIGINPHVAYGHNNLGAVLRERGQLIDAASCFRNALSIDPQFVEAHNNLGLVLQDLGKFDEAESCYRHALDIQPDFAEAHGNLGSLLCQTGDVDAGIESFRRALKLDPGLTTIHGNLIFNMDLTPRFHTEELQAERRKWAALHADRFFQHRKFENSPEPERVLRIGYVSGDFNDHSAASGFPSLLGNYDRRNFEVYAYSNSRKRDLVTESLQRSVCGWREIHDLSDSDAAELILNDKIDILVDLSGFTKGNRLLVFARKPAPVQVSMMGYPTGTGMRAMDVLFVDRVVVPPEEAHLYAEEIRYLPSVIDYSAKRDFPEVNELPAMSNGNTTFGSFNRLPKISAETFALWAQLLKALPQSKLILKAGELDDEFVRARVLRHFSGMEDRVTLLGKTSWLEHVRAYNLVDIALDPFPHGGGVTTIESIRMGVPVLTLRYPTFAGRASASILTALGLGGWIAESEEDYIAIAREKAANPVELAKLRRELSGRFASSTLGDPENYLRAAQGEYRALWRRWCANQG